MKKLIFLFVLCGIMLIGLGSAVNTPTAYYNFNEDADDFFGNLNFFNYQGSPTYTDTNAKNLGALHLTVNNNLNAPQNDIFLFKVNTTLNFWIRDSSNGATQFILSHGTGDMWFMRSPGSEDLSRIVLSNFKEDSSDLILDTGALSTTYRMITVKRNDSGVFAYVNGILNATVSAEDVKTILGTNPGNANLSIGHNGGGDFDGIYDIDEMGWWSKDLTDQEIVFLYNNGDGSFFPFIASTNLISPINNFRTSSDSINFTIQSSSPNNLSNTTLFIWDSSDNIFNTTTFLVSDISTQINISVSNFVLGNYKWNALTCDQSHFCSFALNNRTFSWGFTENSITYNSTTYETESENFILNLTYNSLSYSLSNPSFIYDGVQYPAVVTGIGDNRLITSSLSIPVGLGDKKFYWNLTFEGETFSTSANTQTVLSPQPMIITTGTCSAGLSPSLFYSFADETDRQPLVNTTVNYNFKYGFSGNPEGLELFGNLTAPSNFTVCINSSIPFYTLGYGEIQYFKEDYKIRRFYMFENTRLTDVTISNVLYLLSDISATPFLFNIRDNLYKDQANVFVGLLRWYPEIDEYKTVEMGLTDELGQTVTNLVVGDVDYRVGIYQRDGTLLHLASPSQFVCTTAPCSHFITIPSAPLVLLNLWGIQHSLTFNTTSKIFTFTWNDPTQDTTAMNLTVYKDGFDGQTAVCSTQAEGFTGLILCDVSAYTGTLKALVYRSASPQIQFTNLLVNLDRAITDIAGGKTFGLLLGVILFIFAFLAGIFNPIVAIVLGIVSLIPMFYFGGISYVTLIGIILMGFVVIHFLRRS